jgi:hypothetical protein
MHYSKIGSARLSQAHGAVLAMQVALRRSDARMASFHAKSFWEAMGEDYDDFDPADDVSAVGAAVDEVLGVIDRPTGDMMGHVDALLFDYEMPPETSRDPSEDWAGLLDEAILSLNEALSKSLEA